MFYFFTHMFLLFFVLSTLWSNLLCFFNLVCLGTGHSLTSVKVKAEEALRLHRTSVGEEAREDEDGTEEKREEGEETGEATLCSTGESTSPSPPSSSRGVFSTLTHAVQNTVSNCDLFYLLVIIEVNNEAIFPEQCSTLHSPESVH